MKTYLIKMRQGLRTLAIDWSCGAMNWVSDRLYVRYENFEEDEGIVYALLIWIDRRANNVFSFAYPGSDEEAEQAVDAGIPAKHMSERQRAIALEAFEHPVAHCNHCCWCGFIWQAADCNCPSCGDDSIYWDERSRAWVPYTDDRALVCVSTKGGAK